jgi:hypothetical protein
MFLQTQRVSESPRWRMEDETHLSGHSDFEAVTKVDVDDPPTESIHQQIGGMTISESEDVPDHGHDSEGTAIVAATVEPCLRVARLEPEDAVEVLAGRVVERVLEHFELLHEAEVIEVGCHL